MKYEVRSEYNILLGLHRAKQIGLKHRRRINIRGCDQQRAYPPTPRLGIIVVKYSMFFDGFPNI